MTTLQLMVSAAVFFAIGSLAACIVTILLGVAGVPGALLATFIQKGASPIARRVGILLVILCQSYVALAFAAAITESTRSIVGNATGIGMWAFWTSAFFVAIAPAAIARASIRSYLNEKPENHNPATLIGFRTTVHTSRIGLAGFILFILFPPAVSWAWEWVPHF